MGKGVSFMNRAEQQPVRKIDARGIYNFHGGDVNVREPEDLVKAGISISFEAVAATWGEEKARQYIKPGTVGPISKPQK